MASNKLEQESVSFSIGSGSQLNCTDPSLGFSMFPHSFMICGVFQSIFGKGSIRQYLFLWYFLPIPRLLFRFVSISILNITGKGKK